MASSPNDPSGMPTGSSGRGHASNEFLEVPISERDRELFAMGPMSDLLPIKFESNGYKLVSMEGSCAKCGQSIKPHLMRGQVTSIIPSVKRMEAVGSCMECRIYSRFDYRFSHDGSCSSMKAGGWRRIEPERRDGGVFLSTLPTKQGPTGFSKGFSKSLQLMGAALLWPVYMSYAIGRWALWALKRLGIF